MAAIEELAPGTQHVRAVAAVARAPQMHVPVASDVEGVPVLAAEHAGILGQWRAAV